MKNFVLFIFTSSLVGLGLYLTSPTVFIVLGSMFCLIVLMFFIDSIMLKLPESNKLRTWWRKNVIGNIP